MFARTIMMASRVRPHGSKRCCGKWVNLTYLWPLDSGNTQLITFMVVQFITLIVSITKLLIVIGSPRTYLSHNGRAITWVSNWTFCNWIPVIGYPLDSHVNYARFNGFLCTVCCSFQSLWKAPQTFSLKRSSQKTFFIPTFVTDTIN